MNILQVTAYYPPSIGGIQYYVQSLSQTLARQGHNVDILTVNTDESAPLEVTAAGVRVKRCALDLSLYRAVLSREFNRKLMAATAYDLYHVHIPFHVGLEVAIAAAKRNSVPLIATHHGQGLKGTPLYTLLAGAYSWFSRAVSLQHVDRTVFLTQSYAQSLWLPKAVREQLNVVRTGAAIDDFSDGKSGAALRQKFGLAATTPLVLFVGSLHKANRYKGVDYLLRALSLVNSAVDDVRLMVVGGGDLLAELQALAHQLNLGDKVIFTGPVKNSDLPAYYAASELLVLPSIRGPENAPIVVFEAMASGKPVVASDLPGVRDIVRDEKNGLLVPPKDSKSLGLALIRVLTDKPFRQALGREARLLAESYSWEHCAREMETLYQEVVSQ